MAVSVTIVGAVDRSLADRLHAAGMNPTSVTRAELQALAHPSSLAPDVVVLDLRSQAQIPAALAQVKRQHPETGLVVVASTLDPALMLEAMRSGVTECVTDVERGELEGAISRLVGQRTAPVAGKVFVFVGAKGGVGTTTAAVNIATALAKYDSTLLIDLHMAGGDAALYLSADSSFSVIDALENTHRLDVSFFRGLLTRTKAGPDLLASTEKAVTMPVDSPRVRTLIDFASHHYRYTVLDIPRSDSAVLDSLEASTTIFVVANQEVATIRSAGRVTNVLRQRYGKDKVSVVLSRADRNAEIDLEDMKKAVGGPVTATFPSDYRLAVKALNRGQPLVLDAKTPLATAFLDFAAELAGTTSKKDAPPEKGTGLFGMLTGRR